jgi:hypothetical protein
MNPYLAFKEKIKPSEISAIEKIESYPKVMLSSLGSEDVEGYQVFTSQKTVKDMVDAIGLSKIRDLNATILEPTSGDGAFTTFILLERLKAIDKKKDDFLFDTLRALSTIYSIEMDKTLVVKQRNNLLTTLLLFLSKNNISLPDGYEFVAKAIIYHNCIWAMFNSNPGTGTLFGVEVAYKMPNAAKGDYISLQFPVWKITKDHIDYHTEDPEA